MILALMTIFNSILVLVFSWAVFVRDANPAWLLLYFLMSFLFYAMVISLGKRGDNQWWGKDTDG